MRHTLTLAALLVLPVAADAQSRWKEIGKTASGNSVFVDTRSVRRANGIVYATVRVRFTQPVQTANGAITSSRTVAMFDCAKKTVAAKSTVYYSDAAGTKVAERSAAKIPGYGPAIGGSMTAVALDYLCANAKK